MGTRLIIVTKMFRIAKNLVKTLEQSVQDTFSLSLSNDSNYQLDAFFQSIPPQLLYPQIMYTGVDTVNDGDDDGTGGYYSGMTPQSQDQTAFSSPTSQRYQYRIQPNMVNDYIAGLRVVWVDESKITHSQDRLHSYFDYIVGINDMPLPFLEDSLRAGGPVYPDYNRIITLFNAFCGSSVKLNVWSAKGGSYRNVHLFIVPKDESHLDDISLNTNGGGNATTIGDNYSVGGETSVVPSFQKLGFKVQWTPLVASTFTYHILQLNIEDGPAQLAGLIPDEDYIIGCQDGLLATGGETLLQDIVRSRANHELVLYVYNKISDSVRPVTVSIGGNGRLGCSVGYGFLHRIPTVRGVTTGLEMGTTITTDNNDTTAQETKSDHYSGQTFVPSEVKSFAPQPQKRKKKQHHTATNATGASSLMAEYFEEGKDPHPAPKSRSKDAVLPPPHSAQTTTTTQPAPVVAESNTETQTSSD